MTKASVTLLQVEKQFGIGDGRLYLQAIAHNTGIVHQSRYATAIKACDLFSIKIGKGAAVVFSLA